MDVTLLPAGFDALTVPVTVESPSGSRIRARRVLDELNSIPGSDPESPPDSDVATYTVPLDEDRVVSVSMPGSLRPYDAVVVVDHLRELADGLANAAGTADFERSARQELLRLSRDLADAAASRLDDAQKEHLLEAYDLFRQAVVEYLRGAE